MPPSARPITIVCLWAANERYGPHFVGAVAESLDDAHPEEVDHLRDLAEEWFENWGDDKGWRFWTSYEQITAPATIPPPEAVDAS